MSPRNDDEPRPEKQRKKNKVLLFHESGMTDAQRRKLRQDQRAVGATLKTDQGSMEELEAARETNNKVSCCCCCCCVSG